MKTAIISFFTALLMMPALVVNAGEITGNNAPNGNHYNLNIIGVKQAKNTNMGTDYDTANGHVIFVYLDGKSKINLVEGPDYEVLDKNGTDNNGALLQLPDPNLDPYIVDEKGEADTMSDYSVWVRPLGKPDGWATITTCADLRDSTFAGLLPGSFERTLNRENDLGGYCSVEQVGEGITFREEGKSKFTNVTAQLLTMVFKVVVDMDGNQITDGIVYVRVPIFDDIIENEYWEYDNKGLKLLQVRFYPVGADVSEADDPEAWNNI